MTGIGVMLRGISCTVGRSDVCLSVGRREVDVGMTLYMVVLRWCSVSLAGVGVEPSFARLTH